MKNFGEDYWLSLLVAAILVFVYVRIADTQTQAPPQAEITWVSNQDPKNPETGFRLERKLGPTGSTSPWTQVGTDIAAGVSSVIDLTVLANTEYCYRIRAFNVAGNSAWSNVACGTSIRLNVPAVPSVSLKMSKGKDQLSVAWVAPDQPSTKDWVSLFEAKASNREYLDGWQYTEGKKDGEFDVKGKKGQTYNARYLLNDGYDSIAQSEDVLVK